MVQSQNTKTDLAIKARNLNAFTSSGNIIIGDRAFEYYNEKNKEDYVQIPYDQVDLVTCNVIFGKHIERFAIHTKVNGNFIFTTKDNKKTLRVLSKYIEKEKLRKSLSFFQVISRGFKNLIKNKKW